MFDKQEINLLLEIDSETGAFQNCKIITNLKELIKTKNISLIKNEDGSNERTGSCDFCLKDFEIYLYRLNDEEFPKKEEEEDKNDITEISDLVEVKEEVFAEPIQTQIITGEQPVRVKKKYNYKTKPGPKPKHPPQPKKVIEKTEDGFYKCDVCKTEFHSRRSLGNHVSFCNGNNLGRFRGGPNPSCSFCGKKYSMWSSVRTHERTIHTRTVNYTCEVCGYNTYNKNSFAKHQWKDHKNEKNVICDICQYKCCDKNTMRIHMRFKHMQIDRKICEICAKAFPDATNLKIHFFQKHSDERNFPCTNCERAFKTQRQLNDHTYKVHTPIDQKPQYICEVCLFKTHSHSSFLNHKLIHKPIEECEFECSICKKRFPTKYHLKDHMQVHLVSRPYKCDYCEKGFKRKADLKVHTRYHTGEKPYECEICQQKYSDRGCYRSHLLVHEKQLGIVLDKSVKKFMKKPVILSVTK